MDYLTIEEVAELKGCSIRYVQKLCKTGKLKTTQTTNTKGKMKYLIPVTTLDETLQAKCYNNIRKETGLAPELKSL